MVSTPSGDKPRLTDEQKKQNHIQSEQKRREAIRAGFDRLAELVPGMKGQGRSEAVVLGATVEYLREQLRRKEDLRRKAAEQGWTPEQFESAYQGSQEALDEVESEEEEAGARRGSSGGSRKNGSTKR